MSSASAMVRPPAGRPPPPPPMSRPPPPPPRKAPPPPPKKVNGKPPPPPPPRNQSKPESLPRSAAAKRPAPAAEMASESKRGKVSILAPVVLRDVNVFEKKYQVGQGTYGSVFVGQDKATNGIVALKRINTKQEENGFPITALREVKILKALTHPNIVTLKEIVTSKEQGSIPNNVFMVFEYLEYDLTGVLETPEIRFTQDHVKSWSHQLLLGTHYMHTNKVIHRDLKASNLLINKKGELKIADWGLARSWNSDMKRLTNKVITLWYRPPELLLGALEYTDKVDMWSVGCIIAEMFRRSGFLKGSNEATQLDLIFRTFGHPTEEDWPDMKDKCKLWSKFGPGPGEELLPSRLREALTSQLPNPRWMTDHAIYLIQKLLEMNPDKRWSAEKALDADYFFENPILKTPDKLSMQFAVQSVHEWDCRRKYEQKLKQQQERAAAAAAKGQH